MDNFQKQMFNLGLNTFQTNRQDPQYFKINLDIPAPTPYPCCIIQPFRKREIKEKEKDVNPIMFVDRCIPIKKFTQETENKSYPEHKKLASTNQITSIVPEKSDESPPITRKEKNRRFAQLSRDRKNRYIKELENKVENLESKVMKLNMELEQYKNFMKMKDISGDKDEEIKTVINDFRSTNAYMRSQIQACSNDTTQVEETWKKIIENIGTNVGPKGSIRKKLIKTGFKVVIKHIMPEVIGYLCYINETEVFHHLKEKKYSLLDGYFALCGVDENELEFFKEFKPLMKNARKKAKEVINKLLECRYEIFKITEELDLLMLNLYKRVKPETTLKFFQNFYKDAINFPFFKIWNIKRKQIVHGKEEEREVYALTDSDYE